MTRSELIVEIAAANPSLRDRDVTAIVTTVFSAIASAIARGDRVEFRGFGAFSVKHHKARAGRNPQNGESVAVPEKVTPFFRAGKDLRLRFGCGQSGQGAAATGWQTSGRFVHQAVYLVRRDSASRTR